MSRNGLLYAITLARPGNHRKHPGMVRGINRTIPIQKGSKRGMHNGIFSFFFRLARVLGCDSSIIKNSASEISLKIKAQSSQPNSLTQTSTNYESRCGIAKTYQRTMRQSNWEQIQEPMRRKNQIIPARFPDAKAKPQKAQRLGDWLPALERMNWKMTWCAWGPNVQSSGTRGG